MNGLGMVNRVERDDTTWFSCEDCGLMFGYEEDAERHEEGCDGNEPTYLR